MSSTLVNYFDANFIKHRHIRRLLILITGVFAGYTLEPVPDIFKKYHNETVIGQFLTLFIMGLLIPEKNTIYTIVYSAIFAAALLAFFEFLRTINVSDTDKK